MASTIEYLALGVVAVVLVIAVVQAVQLVGLSDKVTQQNTALTTLATTGKLSTGANAAPVPQQSAPQSSGSQMVGGC